MKKKQLRLFAFITMIALLVLSACNSGDTGTSEKDADAGKSKEDYKFLSILTGGTQGTYYPLGDHLLITLQKQQALKQQLKFHKHLLRI